MNLPIRIRGAGGKSGGDQRAPIEAPDSLRSIAFARVLDLVSEGEIYGFADQENPLKCVYFNETPVMNADGSLNFKDFQIDSRVGTQNQDPMEGFAGVESETGIGVQVEYGQPWTRAFNNTSVTALRVRLSTPSLSLVNTENGDTNGTLVNYAIELSTDGGPFVVKFDGAFNGKASSKYERSHRIELPPAATGWVVRVTRYTSDSTSQTLQNQTWVDSVTEIVDAKLRMPMSAYIGVIINAEQFNNIPSRAYRLRGRLVNVPTNYDPVTRTYTGLWDGTFKIAYTNNPAWVFYDMATNPRYGLGHLLPANLVNKWSLYQIAQYSDFLVDDGFGGLEPRFTANIFRQTQEDAYRVMAELASVFRGMMYVAGGSLNAVGDMPVDPIYTYTPSNVVDGKFTYSGSARKVRHSVALVSWSDLSDFGRLKVEYVEDPDAIARYGIQPIEATAVGATSRGQARRAGKYILATERFETDLCSFKVGQDGTIPMPGSVVLIADPVRAGRRTGGRISASSQNSITVDQMPLVEIGHTVTVALPNGGVNTRTVLDIVDKTITVDANFDSIPTPQSVWLVESPNLKAQRFRVIAVSEENDGITHNVITIRHFEGKFDLVDNGTMIEPAPISDMLSRVLMSPSNIMVSERDVADQNTTQKIVNVSWSHIPQAESYTLIYRLNSDSWVEAGGVSAPSMDLAGMQPGVLEVMITAHGANNVRSQATYAGPFDILPNAKPPKVVQAIQNELVTQGQAIADEAAARSAAILAEQNARVAAISEEATTRQQAIAAEAAARAADVNNLQNNINVIGAQVGDIMQADAHNTANTYELGDLVQSAGKLYRALQAVPAGTLITNTAYWDEVGAYSSLGEAVSATVGRVDLAEQRLATNEGSIIAINNDITALETSVAGKASSGALDALTTRVTTAEGTITAQGQQILALDAEIDGKASSAALESLTTRVTDVEGEVTALSTSSTDLASRVGTMEGALTNEIITSANKNASYAASINSLSTRMTDAEGNVAATSSGLSALDTRVTSAEGTISAHSTNLVNLQAQVDAIDADTGGSGAAIAALDTRVTATEQDIDSMSQDIVALQNSVTSANKIYAQPAAPPTVGGTNGDLWFDTDDGNKPYTLQDGAWVPRKYAFNNRIFIQPTAPIADNVNDLWFDSDDGNKPYRWNGSTWLDISDARTTANATAISSLTSRVTTAEGTITSQGQSITTLQNSVNDPSTGLSATSTAVNSLNTRVTSAEGNINSQASSLQTLTTTVNGNTSSINTLAQSVDGLESLWSVTLDVNNYVSGVYSTNNGTVANFTILADKFAIVAPSGGARTEYSGGNWRVYDASGVLRVRMGVW